MDDQDQLVERLEEQNARTERKLEEVTDELEARKRELWEVYKRLRQVEEQNTLQGQAQGALNMPKTAPPPTTTAASTQTEAAPTPPMLPRARHG